MRYEILANKIEIDNDQGIINILKRKDSGVHYIEVRRKSGGFVVNLRIDEAAILAQTTPEELKTLNLFTLPTDKRKKQIKTYHKKELGKPTCFIQGAETSEETGAYKLKKYDINSHHWRTTTINQQVILDLRSILEQYDFTTHGGELKSQYKNF